MEFLATAPQARSVEPYGWEPLQHFTCGGDSTYEEEVDTLTHRIYNQKTAWNFRAAEMPTGELAGFCLWGLRPLEDAYEMTPYVALIAVHEDFRGKKLPNGLSMGDFLLTDTLTQIQAASDDGEMPAVWALIGRYNKASQHLFERFDFEEIDDPSFPAYAAYLRIEGIPVPAI